MCRRNLQSESVSASLYAGQIHWRIVELLRLCVGFSYPLFNQSDSKSLFGGHILGGRSKCVTQKVYQP